MIGDDSRATGSIAMRDVAAGPVTSHAARLSWILGRPLHAYRDFAAALVR
ncbi:hypothetical protein [Burkholderia ambifaria]|jgi:hypothetical protein|uniref:Uncharacterized protein n=1 Tax=Burkholderia ambifaria IOP40-10 TaxID=396596 RepID=B1F8V7_9BURK|nr:hypothetical protein [Burkholderia ambifaria]EDT06000.1 hypothetical protein BamIOP4010DRAFT_0466 [Burkholderia ambifaria IOP40-10]